MALKPCNGCRKLIDPSATTCPGCGRKDPTANQLARLLSAVAILAGMCLTCAWLGRGNEHTSQPTHGAAAYVAPTSTATTAGEPAPSWYCACVVERDDSAPEPITVTVCRPTADDCAGVERRASRGTDTLISLDAPCVGVDGAAQPDVLLSAGEAWEPTSRAGGWQLRGRCAQE